MNKKTLLILVSVILLTGVFFAVKNLFLNGSPFRSCEYTESILPVPPDLTIGIIKTTLPSYVAIGKDTDYGCLESLGLVTNEIIGPETIGNSSIGKEYFRKQGRAVDSLDVGKKFHVTKIFSVTKHGIGTIDSGRGPINYLIMEDEAGVSYKLATVELGINEEDAFLQFISPQRTQILRPENFKLNSDGTFTFANSSQ